MKMEQSVLKHRHTKIQMLGNYPEESIQQHKFLECNTVASHPHQSFTFATVMVIMKHCHAPAKREMLLEQWGTGDDAKDVNTNLNAI